METDRPENVTPILVEKLSDMIVYIEKSGDPLRDVLRESGSRYSVMDLIPPLKVLVARGKAAPDDPVVATDLWKAVGILADMVAKIERELPVLQRHMKESGK